MDSRLTHGNDSAILFSGLAETTCVCVCVCVCVQNQAFERFRGLYNLHFRSPFRKELITYKNLCQAVFLMQKR